MPKTNKKRTGYYSLRTLILSIILIVLALPLLGIGSLRILESFLHRQTESKLIAEAAYVRGLFLSALDEYPIAPPARHISSKTKPKDAVYDPYFAQIDILKQTVLPPFEGPGDARRAPHHTLVEAGKKITPLLKKVQRQNLSAVRVLDLDGVAVASTGEGLGKDYSDLVEVQQALTGTFASVVRRRAAQPSRPGLWNRTSRIRIHVALPILREAELFGAVYINRTGLSLFVDAWEDYYTVALVLIILVTIGLGLGISGLLIRPFRELIQRASEIASGKEVAPLVVGPTAPKEAHKLAGALTAMIDTLDRRMGYVKEFTQNVSHEFKTPLTSIRGSVEILQSNWQEMTDDERNRFIGIIDADVERMSHLVQRLIELTRLETGKPREGRCDLIACLEALQTAYRQTGHEITLITEEKSVQVGMVEDMVDTIFINLLDNAVKHGNGEEIAVIVSSGPTVTVRDKGPGISEANLKRIFNRFFTTSRESGGTGLGLPMVRAVLNAYGGEIQASSDEKNGTAFTVRFR
jgi:signal transduction histidine kinase